MRNIINLTEEETNEAISKANLYASRRIAIEDVTKRNVLLLLNINVYVNCGENNLTEVASLLREIVAEANGAGNGENIGCNVFVSPIVQQ